MSLDAKRAKAELEAFLELSHELDDLMQGWLISDGSDLVLVILANRLGEYLRFRPNKTDLLLHLLDVIHKKAFPEKI